jgi:cell division septal protein FtsQ
MWFGKKQSARNNKNGKGGKESLFESAPRVGGNRRPSFPLPPAAVIPIAILGGLALVSVVVWWLAGWLFWNNPDYTVKTLTIRINGQSITPQVVRDLTGIAEGTNLFSMSLSGARAQFLKKKPEVKSIVMRRQLPDAMTVEVSERVTLARLGRWGSCGVDRDGWVFPVKMTGRDLPVISGCAETSLRPGNRAEQAVLNAIDVLEACNRSRTGERVRIASIDVGNKEHLELYLAGGERIKLNWAGMGTPAPEARGALDKKLAHLSDALRISEERGRRLVNLDLTFHDQYVPAQEY